MAEASGLEIAMVGGILLGLFGITVIMAKATRRPVGPEASPPLVLPPEIPILEGWVATVNGVPQP